MVHSLNIGIYGYTQAGKTSFLYNLLRFLQQQKELTDPNDKCQQFLRIVGGEIREFGAPRPTITTLEGISFTWQVTYSPREKRLFRIELHDLPGELLDQEAREGFPKDGQLAAMLQRCNAFLFFFNPTQTQDRRSPVAHLTLELDRAEKLLKTMLEGRGILSPRDPGMRPVVFVITAKDIWQPDAGMTQVATAFKHRVAQLFRETWSQAPDKLVDSGRVIREIANPPRHGEPIPPQQGRQLLAVVQTLLELDRYLQKFRLKPKHVIIVIALVMVFLVGALVFMIGWRGDPELERTYQELKPWAESWSFPTTKEKQDQLGELLQKACSQGGRLKPRAADIRSQLDQIGKHLLREMQSNLDWARFDALDRILGPPRPQRTSEQLRQAQARFWEKFRDKIATDLRTAPYRQSALARLNEANDKLNRYRVSGKERVDAELKEAETFLKNPPDGYRVLFEPIIQYKSGSYKKQEPGHGLIFGADKNVDKWWLEPHVDPKLQPQMKGFKRLPNDPPVWETFKWDEKPEISIYRYLAGKWEHVHTWYADDIENKLPGSSLKSIGAPFLGCDGQEMILEWDNYKFILGIKRAECDKTIPNILRSLTN
jgi:hypothetical protein